MVSVEVAADAPSIVAVVGLRLQLTAVELELAQLSVTLPVNPPDGVTLMVEVPELPWDTVMAPLLASAKVGVLGAVPTTLSIAKV